MSQSHFQKFAPKKKNSVIKEEFKQAKKKAKKERAAAINKRFEEKRQMRSAGKSPEFDRGKNAEVKSNTPEVFLSNLPTGYILSVVAILVN